MGAECRQTHNLLWEIRMGEASDLPRFIWKHAHTQSDGLPRTHTHARWSHILIRRLRWSRGNALISGCLSASPSLACCYLQGPNVWRYLHTPDDKQPQSSPRPVRLLTGSCSRRRTHSLFTKGPTQHPFRFVKEKGSQFPNPSQENWIP